MDDKQMIIKCPRCYWEPDGKNHWICSCGNVWNTFNTVGICPSCDRIWEYTQCPGPGFPGGCGIFSKHDDWYIIPINFENLFKKDDSKQKDIKI